MALWNTQNEIIVDSDISLCKSFSIYYSAQREFLKGNSLTKEAGAGQWHTCSEHLTNQHLLSAFSVSGMPLGSWDTAVSKAQTSFSHWSVHSGKNSGTQVCPFLGTKFLENSINQVCLTGWSGNWEVKTLLTPSVWFHCGHKDVTSGKLDSMG